MEVPLIPDEFSRLSHIATTQGQPTETLARKVLSHYIDEEESRFVAAVKRGETELGRGEYLTHEQVGERIARLFQS